MKSIRNSYGISVNMMCASCQHKVNGRLMTTRYCRRKHRRVNPHDYCKDWVMAKGLRVAGRI